MFENMARYYTSKIYVKGIGVRNMLHAWAGGWFVAFGNEHRQGCDNHINGQLVDSPVCYDAVVADMLFQFVRV